MATQLSGAAIGAKLLCFPNGEHIGRLGPALDDRVIPLLEAMLRDGKNDETRSLSLEVDGEAIRLFLELFVPAPDLILIGGVHIAEALAHFAKRLGFRITLIDPRTTFANDQRFPHVDHLIAAWPQEALDEVSLGPNSYVAVLTHDPKLDEPALNAVMGRGAAYVGAIGSRKTHAERFARMAKHGVSDDALAEVHAPIGLDIGAVTPEEIALAIMAEIVAVRRGKVW
ncbi:MAG: XdhC family protein [Ardenticatenales bacterium]|nr:XdhC family protein [Ardenticatenales bacterium]